MMSTSPVVSPLQSELGRNLITHTHIIPDTHTNNHSVLGCCTAVD